MGSQALSDQQFAYQITHTDRSRNAEGGYNEQHSFVQVAASDPDPELTATQMVAARIGEGMVLASKRIK